jgi:hypothetical protein
MWGMADYRDIAYAFTRNLMSCSGGGITHGAVLRPGRLNGATARMGREASLAPIWDNTDDNRSPFDKLPGVGEAQLKTERSR